MMQWLMSWFVLFLLLYVLSRTRPGHTVIYWLAWLTVLFLVVTNADEITSLLPVRTAYDRIG